MAGVVTEVLSRMLTTAKENAFQGLQCPAEALTFYPNRNPSKFSHHFESGIALKVAKLWNMNPPAIAQAIAKVMQQDPKYSRFIEKIDVQGGFINVYLTPAFMSERLSSINQDPRLGVSHEHPQRVLIDFSSPNIAKEMHVGHLRSTIIGDSLARLHEFLGDHVLRINHVGDWGTQFGMLICYMKRHHPEFMKTPEKFSLQDLVTWYKESKKLFDDDEDKTDHFRTQARTEVVLLQSGKQESLNIWKVICEVSRVAFNEIYDLLGVRLEEIGESFYNPLLPGLVEELEKAGLLVESQGAKGVYLYKEEVLTKQDVERLVKEGTIKLQGKDKEAEYPDNDLKFFMVQKSDGGFNYNTTDLIALKYRIQQLGAQKLLYVTDAGQSEHFAQVEKIARKMGFLTDDTSFVHVPFGLVTGMDGKKFKTRSGETVRLIDLLNEAKQKAHEKFMELRSTIGVIPSAAEAAAVSRAVGIGCVRYADLSGFRGSDYKFNVDRMVSFDGKSAAYLQYNLCRVKKILKDKYEQLEAQMPTIALETPSETALALHLLNFPSIIGKMEQTQTPHDLAAYLTQLTATFADFYTNTRVLGVPQEEPRLFLCNLYRKVMEQGMSILGIPVLETM